MALTDVSRARPCLVLCSCRLQLSLLTRYALSAQEDGSGAVMARPSCGDRRPSTSTWTPAIVWPLLCGISHIARGNTFNTYNEDLLRLDRRIWDANQQQTKDQDILSSVFLSFFRTK